MKNFLKQEKKTTIGFFAKDNLTSLEYKTTASSNFLSNFFSGYEATIISFLTKECQLKLLGKTVLDELSCGGTGLLANTGPLFNPFHKKHLIGGSSSGSALAVIEKDHTFSLGSDTGGSIIIPSSYCGLIGFKPGFGSISRLGLFPLSSSLDTIGFFCSKKYFFHFKKIFLSSLQVSYDDLWTVIYYQKKKKLLTKNNQKKIIIIVDIENYLSFSFCQIYKQIIYKLKKNGFLFSKIEIPNFIKKELKNRWIINCFSELVSNLNSFQGITFGPLNEEENIKKKRTKYLGEIVKKRLLIGSYILFFQPEEIEKTRRWQTKLIKWINKNIFYSHSFFLFPPSVTEAPLIEKEKSFCSLGSDEKWYNNLNLIINFSKIPSINIPIGKINKLPISVCLSSQTNNEESLLNCTEIILKIISEEKNNLEL